MTEVAKYGKASALRDEVTPRLLFIALFACMGAFTFGFDNGWWGGVLGNAYFNEVFGTLGVPDATTGVATHTLSASQIAAGTTLGTAFIAIGCMIAGYVADRFGRKFTFYVTAIGSTVGVIIEVTSGINGGRYWQLVAGKMVICASIGVASVSVPLYLAETSPAAIRGALINTYVWIQSIGSFIATAVLYSVLSYTDQRVWVIPIALQMLAPAITLLCAWNLPESPRWLVEKGRIDDARAALVDIRRGKENYDPEEDVLQLVAAHEVARAKTKVSWAQVFQGKDGLRTSIATGVQCLQQGQGLSFMANYLVIFFIQLGIANPYEILLIIYALLTVLTAAGFYVQDFFGRRLLLMVGGSVMCVGLGGVAIITTIEPSPVGALQNACVALIVLWLVGFSQSWTNIPWTVSAELPREDLRDKTLAVSAFGGYVTGMIVGLVNPYMQDAAYGDLGGKVGFIYGAVSIAAVVWVWVMVPELKGRDLAEVDYLFSQNVPLRKMGTYVIDPDFLREAREELDSQRMNDLAFAGARHNERVEKDDKVMDIEHSE